MFGCTGAALTSVMSWFVCDTSQVDMCCLTPRLVLPASDRSVDIDLVEDQSDLDQLHDMLLSERKSRFEPVLRSLNLVPDRLQSEIVGEELYVYNDLFRTLSFSRVCLQTLLLRALDRGTAVETMYKAVVLTAAAKKFAVHDLHHLAELICDMVKSVQVARELKHPWSEICRSGDRKLGFMLERLSARELHFVFTETDIGNFRLFFRNQFVSSSRATPEIIEKARGVPVEVDPNYKAMCLGFKIAYCCESLVRKFPKTGHLQGKMARLRTRMQNTLIHMELGSSLVRSSLAFDLDYRVPESELFEEISTLSRDYLRIFQQAATGRAQELWPFVERLANSETNDELRNEVLFVLSGKADKLIENIQSICEDYMENPKCWNLREELRAVPASKLKEANLDLLAPVSLAQYFFRLSSHRVEQFLIQRAVSLPDLASDDRECCVCFRNFDQHDGVFPVAVCVSVGASTGHNLCERCVRTVVMASSKRKLTCPVCRDKVEFAF